MVLSPRGMDDAHSQAIDDIVVTLVEMMPRKVVVIRGEEGLEWRVGRRRGIANDGEQQSNFYERRSEHLRHFSAILFACEQDLPSSVGSCSSPQSAPGILI
jgi:hypothetical protein